MLFTGEVGNIASIAARVKRWWHSRSILQKTVLSQIVLVVAPIAISALLLYNQMYANSRIATANNGYQYCRFIVESVDMQVRQFTSVANTLSMNPKIREFLISGDDRVQELYLEEVEPLLRIAVHSYLSVFDARIYATPVSSVAARNALTFWNTSKIPEKLYLNEESPSQWITRGINVLGEPLCSYYKLIYADGKPVGILEMRLSPSLIESSVSTINSILHGNCSIAAPDGQALYTSENQPASETGQLAQYLDRHSDGHFSISRNQIGYILRCESLPIVFVAEQGFAFDARDILKETPIPMLGIVLVVLSCIALSSFLLYNGITSRVKLLSLHMDAIQSIDAQPLSGIEGTDEISRLARSYNDMLSRIAELSRSAHQAEMLSQQAAYDALQAQIQPHFLYNTLETLRMTAEANDDEEVADMLFAFGRMLRLSISNRTRVGTVGEEFEHAGYYLRLQKLRIGSRLNYALEPPGEEIAGYACPRFILQPIVENSIMHGCSKKIEPCAIRVGARLSEGGVVIDVFDDGGGIRAAELARINQTLASGQRLEQSGGGIGLFNVRERLAMHFGERAGLALESEEGAWTVCHIRLVP